MNKIKFNVTILLNELQQFHNLTMDSFIPLANDDRKIPYFIPHHRSLSLLQTLFDDVSLFLANAHYKFPLSQKLSGRHLKELTKRHRYFSRRRCQPPAITVSLQGTSSPFAVSSSSPNIFVRCLEFICKPSDAPTRFQSSRRKRAHQISILRGRFVSCPMFLLLCSSGSH
uniref:Uncharacterized protein n=1 Tax=Cucumis melo TaxID=3656 RepID=A0A9I9EHX2_CUCME